MISLIDYENTGNVVDLVDRKPINFIYHGRVLNFIDEISYNLDIWSWRNVRQGFWTIS